MSRRKASLSEDRRDGDVFAWYCIETILNAIKATNELPSSATSKEEHLHRLHLTLIATLPSLSLTLLPRVLEECRAIINGLQRAETVPDTGLHSQTMELVRSLFKEITENVGDAEKEYCMLWWQDNRETLGQLPSIEQRASVDASNDVKSMSRL